MAIGYFIAAYYSFNWIISTLHLRIINPNVIVRVIRLPIANTITKTGKVNKSKFKPSKVFSELYGDLNENSDSLFLEIPPSDYYQFNSNHVDNVYNFVLNFLVEMGKSGNIELPIFHLKLLNLRKLHLRPVYVGNNFLSMPNEYLHASIRGQYPILRETDETDVVDIDEQYLNSLKRINHLISEYLTDFLIVAYTAGSLKKPVLKLISKYDRLSKKVQAKMKKIYFLVNDQIEEYFADKTKSREKKYTLLVKRVSKLTQGIKLKIFTPTIVLPIVSPWIDDIPDQLDSDLSVEEKKVIVNSLRERDPSGYFVFETKHEEEYFKYISQLAKTENYFLTSFLTYTAIQHFSPIFKIRMADVIIYNHLLEVKIALNEIKYIPLGTYYSGIEKVIENNIPEYVKSVINYNSKYMNLEKILKSSFPSKYSIYLGRNVPSNISFLSDLPVEILSLDDLCVADTITYNRFPITPLSNLYYNSLNYSTTDVLEINPEDILIVSGIHEDTEDFNYLSLQINEMNLHLLEYNYPEVIYVQSKSEFVKTVGEKKFRLLMFYGHTYDEDTQAIMVGDEYVTVADLDLIENLPDIILFSSCNSTSWDKVGHIFTSYFFKRGVKAVIGYLFNLHAEIAALYFMRIITGLSKMDKNTNYSFMHFIRNMRQISRLQDMLLHLWNLGILNIDYYANVFKIVVDELSEKYDVNLQQPDIFFFNQIHRALRKIRLSVPNFYEIIKDYVPWSRFFNILCLNDFSIKIDQKKWEKIDS